MATATATRRRTSSRRRASSSSNSNGSVLGSVSRPVGKAVKSASRSIGQLPTWLLISLGVVALGGIVYATGLGSTIVNSVGSSSEEEGASEMETF